MQIAAPYRLVSVYRVSKDSVASFFSFELDLRVDEE